MHQVNETKKFYLTSEFWLHLLAQVLLWVEAIPLEGTPHWVQIAVSAFLAAGYIVSRGLAKAGSPTAVIPAAPTVVQLPAAPSDATVQLGGQD